MNVGFGGFFSWSVFFFISSYFCMRWDKYKSDFFEGLYYTETFLFYLSYHLVGVGEVYLFH